MHLKIFPSLLFLVTTFLLSILLPNSVCGEDERFSSCASFVCGKLGRFGYPFWGNGLPDYCGHPGFKLDCQEEDVTIEILSVKYIVIGSSHETRTLKVARNDFLESICTEKFVSTTLDFTLFSYTLNDQNATLLYNCLPSEHPVPYEFACPENNSLGNAYFVNSTAMVNELAGRCKVVVAVQVLGVAFEGLWNFSLTIAAVLSQGFEVRWIVDEEQCRDCIESGGRCGYNSTLNRFSCFCRDKAYERSCLTAPAPASISDPATLPDAKTHPNKLNWELKVTIGVVAAFVGILITCIVSYIYQRRKKSQYAPSAFLSRNISSDPSSLTDIEKGGSYYGVHLFTYTELEEATNNFDSSKELGDGGFGTVYYGKLQDGRAVAVKRLYENNFKRVEQFMNEVEILTRLRHQNLVSLYGCTSRHSRELLLVYEYIPNGTVADHLHGELAKPGALSWPTRMNIAIETACALSYLHASEIIHRDVKTNNILLDNNFCVKVADFGLSRLFPTDVTHVSTAPQGTPGYVDPEYHQCYQLTNKSDVYSFGVVLIELISSKAAVDITRHRHEINLSNMAINKIRNHELHELVDPSIGFESDYTVRRMITAVAELAFQCLQNGKDMRPPMGEVLEALKDIQSVDYNEKKAAEMDIPRDDVVLLKNDPLLFSPDSVTIKWNSTDTTSIVSR